MLKYKTVEKRLALNRSNKEISLTPIDNHRLADLCGQFDENLHTIEKELQVEIKVRSNRVILTGKEADIISAAEIIHELYEETANKKKLSPETVHLKLQTHQHKIDKEPGLKVFTQNGQVRARSENQQKYIDAIKAHDLCFGIGPAGTGKTFLAIACAVEALEEGTVQKILLVRPAVEAGEHLGFLPGDMNQKFDPYCRPLFDALYAVMGFEKVAKLIERQIIEIAPLAYMRGRTLSDAYVIVDEGQNTTKEQMRMLLTRMGYNCKIIITGDVTQIDLPKNQKSGLVHASIILNNMPEIGMIKFTTKDVVRHRLVQKIITAYEQDEQ